MVRCGESPRNALDGVRAPKAGFFILFYPDVILGYYWIERIKRMFKEMRKKALKTPTVPVAQKGCNIPA